MIVDVVPFAVLLKWLNEIVPELGIVPALLWLSAFIVLEKLCELAPKADWYELLNMFEFTQPLLA